MQNVFGRQIELKVHCCVAQVLDYNCLSISIKSWGAPKASVDNFQRLCHSRGDLVCTSLASAKANITATKITIGTFGQPKGMDNGFAPFGSRGTLTELTVAASAQFQFGCRGQSHATLCHFHTHSLGSTFPPLMMMRVMIPVPGWRANWAL